MDCPICNQPKDPKKINCKICMDRFNSRSPANKMMKVERIRELTWWKRTKLHDVIPEDDIAIRLSELVGRSVRPDADIDNLIEEVKKQTEYPKKSNANWGSGFARFNLKSSQPSTNQTASGNKSGNSSGGWSNSKQDPRQIIQLDFGTDDEEDTQPDIDLNSIFGSNGNSDPNDNGWA